MQVVAAVPSMTAVRGGGRPNRLHQQALKRQRTRALAETEAETDEVEKEEEGVQIDLVVPVLEGSDLSA